MRRVPQVLVDWTFTETHQAPIPVDELADALGVEVASFTPSMLTEREPTEALVSLLGQYQDEESYQHSDSRDITGARPGPTPPTLDELLREADELLDGAHATTGLSDAGR